MNLPSPGRALVSPELGSSSFCSSSKSVESMCLPSSQSESSDADNEGLTVMDIMNHPSPGRVRAQSWAQVLSVVHPSQLKACVCHPANQKAVMLTVRD